jgi:MarR family transcriptional regulator, transcriptional regulator for hemolysin
MSMLCYILADVPAPFPLPIGLRLSQTARAAERAFDEALGEVGGSLPVWLILLNLKTRKPANQRALAAAVGVREATLTHHLNAMHARGLVTRTRDATNRRVQVVALTEAGEAAFDRLRDTAIAFDAKLRAGLADADLATLSTLLGHLAANVGAGQAARPGSAWPNAARSNAQATGSGQPPGVYACARPAARR